MKMNRWYLAALIAALAAVALSICGCSTPQSQAYWYADPLAPTCHDDAHGYVVCEIPKSRADFSAFQSNPANFIRGR